MLASCRPGGDLAAFSLPCHSTSTPPGTNPVPYADVVHLAGRLEPLLREPCLRKRLTKLGTLADCGVDLPGRAGVEDPGTRPGRGRRRQVQRPRREPLVETIVCGGESRRGCVEVIGAGPHDAARIGPSARSRGHPDRAPGRGSGRRRERHECPGAGQPSPYTTRCGTPGTAAARLPVIAGPERAETLRSERDALIREIAAAAGLGGRDRKLGDETERARKTVGARVRDAQSKIERVHPELAAHLRSALQMGTVSSGHTVRVHHVEGELAALQRRRRCRPAGGSRRSPADGQGPCGAGIT